MNSSSSLLDYFVAMNLPSLTEFLKTTSFDELIELNIPADSFRFIYNVEEKYLVPVISGTLHDFCLYAADSLVYPEDKERYLAMMDISTMIERLEASSVPGVLDMSFRIKTPEGRWKWVEQLIVGGKKQNMPDGVVNCYIFDIQHLKDRESGATLVGEHVAARDSLTGLPLQKSFFTTADHLKNTSSKKTWTMVVIDLENFKMFNDWYGRDLGDKVLATLGKLLNDAAKKSKGVAGYLGLDDFCLFFPESNLTVEKIYEDIHQMIRSFDVSIGFLPAIGYAVSEPNVTVLNLYDRAALACRTAKDDFKNRVRAFDNALYRQTAKDYQILSEFRQALAEGEITFFLQPQCRASTGRIVGAESLARWRKADGSFVPPFTFVPVLEKHGFIAELDKYIWEQVCIWLKTTAEKGLPLIPVSVNISQVDIFTMNVPDYLKTLTERYALPKNALKVEITESACAEDSNQVRNAVQELRKNGFTVLMDDFGSGYSSLNVLHEMSFDVIKLDAKFLHLDKTSVEKGLHILESVVNMAKTIGLPIIVEGVETEEQKDFLMSLGCRYVQGYFFYRPMPPEDFEKLISQEQLVDTAGFVAKSNEQFHVREFLNDAVYSDAMLNNILGPVAIYALKNDSVDIIRFNQQFYETVGVSDFSDRLCGIEKFMPPEDAKSMIALMNKAVDDKLNGATSGVLSFSRNDGGTSRFLLHFYYLGETDGYKRFYGSARDVTEITNLNNHMRILKRYFSDTIIFLMRRNDGYSFQIGAHGLDKTMQISDEELKNELTSGTFYNHVVKDDRRRMLELSRRAAQGISFTTKFIFVTGSGKEVELRFKSDAVNDPTSDVRCIITISRIQN